MVSSALFQTNAHQWRAFSAPGGRPATRPPSFRQTGPARGLQQRCWSADEDAQSSTQTLPIFPLGIVALPQADVPLQIFEARYRVLFNTLLAGEEGVLEDLVQDDSPFKGTKRFGMCYTDRDGLSKHGTVLEIVEHKLLEDGRILILTKGRERFMVHDIKQERPVLLCSVQLIHDEEEDDEALRDLAAEVRDLFRRTLELNGRYKKIEIDEKTLNPPELENLSPSDLSFWITSMFAEAVSQQQKMLEMRSARERLESVKKVLSEGVNYLSAVLAVESAFQPAASGGAEEGGTSSQQKGDDTGAGK